jgi:hypothetical protein
VDPLTQVWEVMLIQEALINVILLDSVVDDHYPLSSKCRRRVADMSPTSPNVAKSWATLRVVATQKRPRHTQFMSITADKYKSAQTYELATLP